MNSRLIRISLLSVVLGLMLIGVGAFAARSPAERAAISRADDVAAAYEDSLTSFQVKTNQGIIRKFSTSVGKSAALLTYVDERIAAAPKVPTAGTTSFGRGHSGSYRSARDHRQKALQSYEDLSMLLRVRAQPVEDFINAGKKLLFVSPTKLLKDQRPIQSGEPLRRLVLPEFRKARSGLKGQKAPASDPKLLGDLEDFAKGAIKQTQSGAKTLDAGGKFFYKFGERPNVLYRRLLVIDSALKGAISRQVETTTGGS